MRLPAQSSAAQLEQPSARKPSSGMDIICGGASAITDTRPANTPPSTLATAIERRTGERLGQSLNLNTLSRWRASVSPRPTAGSAATAALALSMAARKRTDGPDADIQSAGHAGRLPEFSILGRPPKQLSAEEEADLPKEVRQV